MSNTADSTDGHIGLAEQYRDGPASAGPLKTAPAIDRPVAESIAAAVQKATAVEQPVPIYLSVSLPLVDLLPMAAANDDVVRTYWEKPDENFAMATFGAVVSFDFDSPVSRESTMHHITLALERAIDCSPEPVGAGSLRMVGGFAFDLEGGQNNLSPDGPSPWAGFPRGRYLLPEALLIRRENDLALTVVLLAEPRSDVEALGNRLVDRLRFYLDKLDDDPQPEKQARCTGETEAPGHETWVELVRLTQKGMGPDISKVVLARTLQLTFDGPIALYPALNRLRSLYPSCISFLFHFPGLGSFLGATPERLVRLEGQEIYTEALAGTFPRGATEQEDQQQRRLFLSDRKERAEHQFVVDAIRDSLAPVTTQLEIPGEPGILSLRNVMHLLTPIRARLKEPIPPLTLAALLHPTPAVGVTAKREAREVIGRYEHQDRGWYSGVLSWIDSRGNGDFIVGLRSALLRDTTAYVFAGAGIVSASVPEKEWQETKLKMRPLIRALCNPAEGVE